MTPDGKQWLAWQNSSREDYVTAYISGYFYGVKDACFVFDDLEPTISLLSTPLIAGQQLPDIPTNRTVPDIRT